MFVRNRMILTFLAFVFLSFGFAQRGIACAVCGVQDGEASRVAYLVTTAILSAIPLLFIGGVAFYVYKRAKTLHDEPSRELVNESHH